MLPPLSFILVPTDRDHAHRRQTSPVALRPQPTHVVADAGDVRFDTANPFAHLDGQRHRSGRVVQKKTHVIMQNALTAFQSQRLAPQFRTNHLRGYPALAAPGGGGDPPLHYLSQGVKEEEFLCLA